MAGGLTNRSRDNFPNPIAPLNPYVPINSPAISDLFELFSFGEGHGNQQIALGKLTTTVGM